MACRKCLKRRKVNRGIPPRVSEEALDIEFPIVYVVCRNCGALRTMRFNIATQFVKQECEQCNNLLFHVMKQAPSPELLKKLIIK